jgi:hypothetical protein
VLTKLYNENIFLLDSGILTDTEKEYYKSVNMSMDKVTAFFRSMFNATFKTNPYLERAIMTGITRVSKESMFSDLNNLEVVTTTSDRYAAAFGFTEEEVFAAMDEMGLTEKDEVKFWYDGFVFGNMPDIYNPWSIINYLDKGKFATYWANTSSNSLVGRLIREGDKNTKREFEHLFIEALLINDIDAMNDYMNRVALNTFSYFDTGSTQGKMEEPERFYHGFVLGMIVDLRDKYVITSNRESGFGRYDIMLEPIDKERYDGIVIEFKVFNKRREKNIQETIKAALKQIEDRNYVQTLIDRGVKPEHIRKYGFAFEGKNVEIGE